MTTLVPPAEGLQQLTWKQVEDLDAKIRSLCVFARQTGEEVHLTIIINKNGLPFKVGRPLLMDRFKPTAL